MMSRSGEESRALKRYVPAGRVWAPTPGTSTGTAKVTTVLLSCSPALAFGVATRQSTVTHSPVPIPLRSFISLRDFLRLICTAVMMHPLDVVGFTRGCTPENPADWGQWRANQSSVWRARREDCCPILTAVFPLLGFVAGAEAFGVGKVLRCSGNQALKNIESGFGQVSSRRACKARLRPQNCGFISRSRI